MPAEALFGFSVLVTRPVESSKNLVSLIRANGGTPFEFPVIKIDLMTGRPAMHAAVSDLGGVDLAVFVSVHAVRSFAAELAQDSLEIPPQLKIAAIGPATAAELASYGCRVDDVPEGVSNSEGLIETLRQNDYRAENVVIFRGQSGRESLSDYLRNIGASVTEVESYRRTTNPAPIGPVLEQWVDCPRRLLTLTSVDIMQRLLDKTPKKWRHHVYQSDVAVLSQRIAESCRKSGFSGAIQIADCSGDKGLVNALIGIVQDTQD
jgi:uroporphyrinogen-III synthase